LQTFDISDEGRAPPILGEIKPLYRRNISWSSPETREAQPISSPPQLPVSLSSTSSNLLPFPLSPPLPSSGIEALDAPVPIDSLNLDKLPGALEGEAEAGESESERRVFAFVEAEGAKKVLHFTIDGAHGTTQAPMTEDRLKLQMSFSLRGVVSSSLFSSPHIYSCKIYISRTTCVPKGVSVVDGSPKELIYASLHNMRMDVMVTHQSIQMNLGIRTFQVC
jgi:hypothetical protein